MWEIADIGIIVRYRIPEGTVKRKIALLQSKRLVPSNTQVRTETQADYSVGFGRLDDPEDERRSLAFDRQFQFTENSRYGEIEFESKQTVAMSQYKKHVALDVYYQLYNPWTVPWEGRIPIADYKQPLGDPKVGVRILPIDDVHSTISAANKSPSLSDVSRLDALPRYGWRLERFMADLLACRHGGAVTDEQLAQLFNRRSGPISAAISITIEAPDQTLPMPWPPARRAGDGSVRHNSPYRK